MTTTEAAQFVPRGADTWADPFGMYRALRDQDPVHHVERGDYWVLSRFADVFAAARDTETFSSADGLTFSYGERERLGLDFAPMVMLDPPDHTAFRRLVGRGFTPRKVAELEPAVRAFVDERLDSLIADGGGDVVDTVFKPLPSFVVAHYLGVPPEDRGRFDAWTEAIVGANSSGDASSAVDAVVELAGYFTELAERRRHDPGDDMTTALVQASLDGEPVSVEEVLGFAFTMVTGGNDTTTGLLGGSSVLLTEHPDQRQRLIDDRSLLPGAVEELLRLVSPVQGLARTTTRDVEIDGVTVPAGRKVLLLYGSANRDEREFGDDAESLDLERPIDKILTFGYGAHHCLGASAARLQGRVALDAVLTRCPNFVADGERARFADGHFVRRHSSLPFDVGVGAR